ncbi:type II toxin-antitoxin system VapC family toxin [Sphingomonas sp. MMSM20]|uniref:type II toxin-antitoxin system VapC family toxin n=1 Tax=Sphingomonas lycopersici TaxID=2951807 RepID=UPI0022383267|nr:type II toxin-antitoxin system VapC family toxin [Sphingomonas lycopersici]MCW6532873.1 type II toxin-antitoxin system VapC family toxin [Sphingomonas lycopersici]
MKVLLDTHTILWWLGDDRRLGGRARAIIENPANDIIVSAVSLWEIVVKVRVGKLRADIAEIVRALEIEAFDFLAIRPAHLQKLAELPTHHRDPFDHLLIAQSIVEGTSLMTDDRHAALYPARIIGCSDDIAPSDSPHELE